MKHVYFIDIEARSWYPHVVVICECPNSPIESTMADDPIEIKHCVQICGGGLGRRVTIPHELLKQDSGVTYIHCSTVPKCIASLFVGRGNGGGVEERRFSRTNVFEVITKLRNAKIDEHTQTPEPQETLSICGGNNKPKRVNADKKLEAPVSIEVDAPRIWRSPRHRHAGNDGLEKVCSIVHRAQPTEYRISSGCMPISTRQR